MSANEQDVSLRSVRLGSEEISFELRRSERKTLGVTVEPDLSLVVRAPRHAADEMILSHLRDKASWILSTRREFAIYLPNRSERRYVPGETHQYLGKEYRLALREGVRGVRRDGDRIVVGIRSGEGPSAIEPRLKRWYSARAKETLPERLDVMMPLFQTENLAKPGLTIRRLDKRWGSMSADGLSMLLNVRLVEADRDEIDYVLVHELCHILHPNHGPEFFKLLHRKLPDWRRRKASLEMRLA